MFKTLKNNISNNQLKYGAILSYLQMGLNIIFSLLFTPYLIRMLGQSEYGLYNTVSSTIMTLSILNLGLYSGYIKYFTNYKTNENHESINRLNGLYVLIFSILGFIVLICGLGLSFNLELIFNNGLTKEEYEIAKILAILITINLAISFPANVFPTIVTAYEKFVFLKILTIIRMILFPAIMVPILIYGYKSIAMTTVSLILSIFFNIIYFYYCREKLNIRFAFNNIDKSIVISLFTYTFFIALNIIVDQINWNVDKLLLGRFKGTVVVAIYSVAFSLYNFYDMLSSSVSEVFTPRVHNIINIYKDEREKCYFELNSLFVKIGRIQFLILALIVSGVIVFGKPFIEFWVGKGYEDSYYVAIILMIPASISLIQKLGIEIQRAENKHQFRSIAYIIMALVNLVLSIYLCQLYGAVGCAIGTAVSLILANGLIMNIYYYFKCGIDVIDFWKNIIRMSWGLILPITVSFLLPIYFDYYTKTGFVAAVSVYTFVYCFSMWFISMNQYEKSLIPFFKRFYKIKEL